MESCVCFSQLVPSHRLDQAFLWRHSEGLRPQARLHAFSIQNQALSCLGFHAERRATTSAMAAMAPRAEELKSQLEALQKEAEQVRFQANSARNRFMRLSEAAERLRMRAAFEVKSGREDSARQMLLEKQKVMKALQNSKDRAEVLKQLGTKLAEAISIKETQLITALSSGRLQMDDDDGSIGNVKTVRVVSPSGEASILDGSQTRDENNIEGSIPENSGSDDSMLRDVAKVNCYSDLDKKAKDQNDLDFNLSVRPHTYFNFLTDIDGQLHEIEQNIQNFLYFAAMVLEESMEATVNNRVSTMKQIWHDIQNARSRVQQAFREEDLDITNE